MNQFSYWRIVMNSSDFNDWLHFLTRSLMPLPVPEYFMLPQDMHMVGNNCFYENLVEDSMYILLTSTSHAKCIKNYVVGMMLFGETTWNLRQRQIHLTKWICQVIFLMISVSQQNVHMFQDYLVYWAAM